MIHVENLSKYHGRQKVVDDINLHIPAGGITSIVGPNGAGKSTLLAMISRLAPMSSGSVTVAGMDILQTDTADLAKRLAILRQDNSLALRLTVRDIVAFGRYPHSRGRLTLDDEEHIERALDYLNLRGLAHRYLDQLSGGQRQRAFIAMVLCQDTDCVLLDEPLNSLDIRNAVDIMQVLRRAADELNRTIVMVMHDINFAARYSDLIVGMRDGRILCSGTPAQVVNPGSLKALYDLEISVHTIDGCPVCVHYGG